ncbi:MAG TPA: M48 family metallopeptidase [Ktedonobacterales bacterium]|nr:M48 family metallopeptidase [Ktedonobacterales bacterium]
MEAITSSSEHDSGQEAVIAPAEIDPQRQEHAQRYARLRHWLLLVDLGIAGAFVLILLGTGLTIDLRTALAGLGDWQPVAGWSPLQVAVLFCILMVVYQLLTTPLSYYSGFILPRRYGLSHQSLASWLADQAKDLALGFVFEIAAVLILYLLLAAQPDLWWLWAALALLLFSVVLANLAPVLILPLFFKLKPLEDEELKSRLLALAERANTRVRGVFTMDMSRKTSTANAALMGLGNTRRIVLGDTLLSAYTPDEIEVVLAHELGHHVHRDIWKLIATQTLLTLGGLFLVNLGLHWAVEGAHIYPRLSDAATMPAVALALGLFGLVTMPLTNGYSRLVERQADEYALTSTCMPDAFISAMTRLANQNLAELNPSPVIEFLLYDHPAIGKRLQHGERFKAQQPA